MLRIDKVIKPWKDADSLNSHINLYGFWNETTFLTKSGDLGMVLSVPGVDYESLDHANQEYAVKRLEAALKSFGPGFHVYQYLFKSNRPEIPFASYDDPVVQAAIDQRRQFFESKRDRLYQIEIFYCIVLEGARSKTGVGAALSRLFSDPAGAIDELKTQFTNSSMKTLLRSQIDSDLARLTSQVQAFVRQLVDFMQIEVLNQQGQFRFFRRLLNYDDWRVAGRPKHTQFLDYQVVNSNLEGERDHLRVFMKNETIRNYVVQAQKTWRKHNAAMILATQSIKELEQSGMLQTVAESCPTKIFLANPEMNRDVYREAFHLNDTEVELIAGLVPPGQMLIRKAQISKKVHLNVDSVTHWMATNNARDNLKKREYFERYGIAEGLRRLAQEYPFQPRLAVIAAPNLIGAVA